MLTVYDDSLPNLPPKKSKQADYSRFLKPAAVKPCEVCGIEISYRNTNKRTCTSCRKKRSKHKASELLKQSLYSGLLNGRSIIPTYFNRYKQGANKRQLAFELSMEQFTTMWQQPCYYCGDPIQTIGIDRVINSIGYIVGNCVPCCTRCNRCKHASNQADFIRMCKLIASRHS